MGNFALSGWKFNEFPTNWLGLVGSVVTGKPCSGVKVEAGYKLSADQVGAVTNGGFCHRVWLPRFHPESW
jgi:hypothetical protein